MLTGRLIREARALVRWSPEQLAKRAGVPLATIVRAERENGEPTITIAQARAIGAAFEARGILFNGGPDTPAGVSLGPRPDKTPVP